MNFNLNLNFYQLNLKNRPERDFWSYLCFFEFNKKGLYLSLKKKIFFNIFKKLGFSLFIALVFINCYYFFNMKYKYVLIYLMYVWAINLSYDQHNHYWNENNRDTYQSFFFSSLHCLVGSGLFFGLQSTVTFKIESVFERMFRSVMLHLIYLIFLCLKYLFFLIIRFTFVKKNFIHYMGQIFHNHKRKKIFEVKKYIVDR